MSQISKAKVLALLAPVISVLSGAIAAWLLVHVHVLGIFHVGQSQVASDIAAGAVFIVSSALVWLSHHEHFLPITEKRLMGAKVPHAKTLTAAEIVAFLTPYISLVAGALASWLFVHVHFLGLFHVAQKGVAAAVAGAIVFGVTAVITWAAHQFHWLPITLHLSHRTHKDPGPAPVPPAPAAKAKR